MKTILALLSILSVYCANGQQRKSVNTQSGIVFNVQTGGTIFTEKFRGVHYFPKTERTKKTSVQHRHFLFK
ncbi:hypothetical protein AEM51_00970 [Bacteroidetes bacterium UKL13-3]|jgi:hypothetical protein|nr:hypothetical protein AEM51_00970 [Bacteroidetes bacterium UKL13-3]HCP92723.1 hypothetical protein [Bacteroidota bacterium]